MATSHENQAESERWEAEKAKAGPGHDQAVEVICRECGDLIEVKDPAALVRALHLVNVCEATARITGNRE